MQKKAVVIRHLYNEDGANIPEDTETDVNEAFDVCDLKAAEITIPELQVSDINCEQQVRIWGFLNRCQYFLLWCTWLFKCLTFVIFLVL